MCWFRKKKEEPKPDWVTQSRKEVAEAQLYAASTHYSVMVALEEGNITPENWGDYEWNEYWWKKHQEAAWYTEHLESK